MAGTLDHRRRYVLPSDPTFASITILDDGWVGLGAAKGRMEFDDQATDEINFLDCNVGIGTSVPETLLHIKASNPVFRIENTAAGMKTMQFFTGATGVGIGSPSNPSQFIINEDAPNDGLFVSSTALNLRNGLALKGSGTGGVLVQTHGSGTVGRKIQLQGFEGGVGWCTVLSIDNTASGKIGLSLVENGGNVGIGATTFGTDAAKTFAMGLDTVPTGDVANQFAQYAADIAAGNTVPHFRTENGTVIRFNQSLLTTDPFSCARIEVDGPESLAIQTVTGNTTLDNTHSTVLVNASGNVTITLPTVASAYNSSLGIGRIYEIKKIDADADTVTLDPDGSEEIEFAATLVLTVQGETVTIQSNGTAWYII